MGDSKNKIKLVEWRQVHAVWDEEHDRLTREAFADVDAGCVIDHQAVQAWADNLGVDEPLRLPRL